MTILDILESLILGPLTILFECIFSLTNVLVHNPGLSIVALSLIMNILVLPLYKRADDMQEEARKVEAKLQKGVAQIKKHFTGDERMMILQTYYNQNNYKPTHALKGSISLLLQIPFFMAAYNFLSHLAALQGASFGPIADLGAPDGMLVIGGLSINLLPILMTLINVISGVIYLRGFPLKTKIQTYGLALFFLIFLYNSPAGLVFYWTLNNVFSLGKSIFYKFKIPNKVIYAAVSAIGLIIMAFGVFGSLETTEIRVYVLALGLMCQGIWLLPVFARLLKKFAPKTEVKPNKTLFTVGSVFLTVLVGALISSTYIAASPQEFVDITYFYHPLWFVLNSTCLAAGTFLVWLRVFYWLAKPGLKVFFERAVWAASVVMLINYMFFGRGLGMISPMLQYQIGMVFTNSEIILNTVVAIVGSVLMYLFAKKWGKVASSVLMVAAIALSVMSVKNVLDIKTSVDEISLGSTTSTPGFELSKDGQNVVVIVLDRAAGNYVPYVLNEKPELKEKLDGFTYYDNVVSFGKSTVVGLSPVVGGYEYTPVEMNRNDSKLLVEKHNEALKLMPTLFSQNGYDVTVCDPTYANYSWIPDLSIFDEYPEIDTYITESNFNEQEQKEYVIRANYRNFFCFGVMRCMPILIQPIVYHRGNYNITSATGEKDFTNQVATSKSTATGISHEFMDAYNVLNNFINITTVTEESKNTFLVLQNHTTHEPTMLQTPDYVPSSTVDNTAYDAEHSDRFVLEDGRELRVANADQMKEYHTHVAALMRLAEWMDYLRENDVYDNTRIILVSDHANLYSQTKELQFDDPGFSYHNAQWVFPLLMVKDFNSEGFTVSSEFMTNADVPTLAMAGVIENPVNPFTGKPINSDEKYAHDQYILFSGTVRTSDNTGSEFGPAPWLSITNNIWDKDDWEFCTDSVVLKEHAFPE